MHTAAAASREASAITVMRRRSTFMPSAWAVSSPNAMMLSEFETSMLAAREARMIAAGTPSCPSVTPERPPMRKAAEPT